MAANLEQAIRLFERGEYEQVADCCDQLLAHNPNHPEATCLKGMTFFEKGELSPALQFIKKAVLLNPGNASFYYNLGNVYLKLGKGEDALLCYKKASEVDPGFAKALLNWGAVALLLGRSVEAEKNFAALLSEEYAASLTPADRQLVNGNLRKIQQMGSINIDPSCSISPHCTIEATGRERIVIGKGSKVGDYAYILARGGYIEIGRNCTVQNFCRLCGHGGLTIGDDVRIASQTVIIPANHNFDRTDIPIRLQGETCEGITIGDDVWIGTGCKILDGVAIGTGSVIGAGSVVTKSIPEYSVAAGVPARVIRKRGEKNEDRGLPDESL